MALSTKETFIQSELANCSRGMMQSPIDLACKRVSGLKLRDVEKIGTVSSAQVNLLREAVHDADAVNNAMPLQSVNGRFIKLYLQVQVPPSFSISSSLPSSSSLGLQKQELKKLRMRESLVTSKGVQMDQNIGERFMKSGKLVCNKGDMQSPIDLVKERVRVVPTLGRLKRSYKPSNATIKNRGHDIMLEWEGDAGSLWINGSEFLLKQCHWHSPSEHSVNGKRFALEAHLVHQSTDGKIAVVGIMYKIGRPDSFLKELEDRINEIGVTRENGIEVGKVDPRHVKIGSRKYHRYMGSLTTPPCTEGVTWTIVNKVRTASRAQLKLLRDAVHDDAKKNARPKQEINEREIKFYTPKFHGIYPH
ncbi:hypothetical protein J5N97_023229 [Dioscorea zingiberensis]|uniref:Carbonic anhydrase n=1 Tax=Dioscorea zingiberensis TaxID=325984 RepID=A0A9D5HBK5_9LILI|nr:hypothetical protein J5N97_023229 [Dioscorea zingiberensis]